MHPLKKSNKRGFIYIAAGAEVYLKEALISAKSLRRFTKYPIYMITNDKSFQSDLFDGIIYAKEIGEGFEAKIKGLLMSPFDRTVFLDVDTFVVGNIDEIFEAMEIYDILVSQGPNHHSESFIKLYCPDLKLRFKNVIPEFNTGVIGYTNAEITRKFIEIWSNKHREINCVADMVSFREAFIDMSLEKNAPKIGILPPEYNLIGFKDYIVVYNKVKILHGRVGERWNNLRPHMASFKYMDKLGNRINKYRGKRLYVHPFGVVPCSYSLFNVKRKLKKLFGVKQKRKRETLPD